MSQEKLLSISMALKPGFSYVVNQSIVVEAARGELTGLDRLDVRKSDVVKFIEKVSDNWGITITKNKCGDYIIHKIKKLEVEYEFVETDTHNRDHVTGCLASSSVQVRRIRKEL